jgi:hypothetical protein
MPDYTAEAEGRLRASAERCVRRLQIPSGRAALLERLRGGNERPEEGGAARHSGGVARAMESLAALVDMLPQSATPAEWARVVEDLFPWCSGGSDSSEADLSAIDDENACGRLIEALYGVHELNERIEGQARRLPRAEALALMADIAAHENLPAPFEVTGRVRVLPAISARGVDARHVYFAGLTEDAMPQRPAQGYYSPRETARLIRDGLPLVSAERHYEEEMLLFYEVVSRAADRLVLSYAALDEKAQPVLPSPFVEEVRRAAGECIQESVRLDLRPVDRERAPLCLREYRTRAVCDAVVDGSGTDRLQTLVAANIEAGAGPAVLDGLRIVAARAEWDKFGPAEGLFTSEEAARALAQQFGPEHLWSPTALEQIALCPFRFLMEHVLKIEPLDDLELATDYRRRGGLVHQCLAELYQRLERAESLFLSSHVDAAAVKAGMLAFVEEQLKRLEGGGYSRALEALDLEQVRSFSETLHLQQQCYDTWNGDFDGPPWPVHFEVRFGKARGDSQKESEDPLSTDAPFELELGDERIKLIGRIDRIDVGAIRGAKVFNIIDYKTGEVKSLSAKDVRRGLALQIPLYAMAVEEHLLAAQGTLAWQADYWWLREAGFGNKKATATSGPFAMRELTGDGLAETAHWRELKASITDRVRQIVHSVRRGEFVVSSQDPDCMGKCPYSGVCRVSQVRSMEKEWGNGGMEENEQ